MTQQKLVVALKRNYGAEEISFGIEEIIEISGGPLRQAAFDNLIEQVLQQHDHYASAYLHTTPAPVQADYRKPDGGFPSYEVLKITRKLENGKNGYRIHCGPWTKFGALVYPEVVRRFGIADMVGELWEFEPTDLYATIDTSGKSPKAVSFAKG